VAVRRTRGCSSYNQGQEGGGGTCVGRSVLGLSCLGASRGVRGECWGERGEKSGHGKRGAKGHQVEFCITGLTWAIEKTKQGDEEEVKGEQRLLSGAIRKKKEKKRSPAKIGARNGRERGGEGVFT